MRGRIAEVFEGIQGEGLYLGQRQVFVRLFGCNLSCKYCDTPLTEFKEYDPPELMHQIRQFPQASRAVSFTGGEPLLQRDFLKEIMRLTHASGYKNYLETNGLLFNELEDVVEHVDIVAMDIKLASSTGLENYWRAHRRFLEVASHTRTFVKIVIGKDTGFHDVQGALELVKGLKKDVVVILQPNSDDHSPVLRRDMQLFKELFIAEGIKTRIIPQMHKIAGDK